MPTINAVLSLIRRYDRQKGFFRKLAGNRNSIVADIVAVIQQRVRDKQPHENITDEDLKIICRKVFMLPSPLLDEIAAGAVNPQIRTRQRCIFISGLIQELLSPNPFPQPFNRTTLFLAFWNKMTDEDQKTRLLLSFTPHLAQWKYPQHDDTLHALRDYIIKDADSDADAAIYKATPLQHPLLQIHPQND